MPIKLRSSDLESASARLKLKPRKAPYRVRVARGVALGYRRTADSFGTWNVIVACATTVRLVNSVISTNERRDSQEWGWNACLDQLEAIL